MPTLPQRIAAIEQRWRDADRKDTLASSGGVDPAEAARAYEEIVNGIPWVPTHEEVRRHEQWSALTALEATQVYFRMMNDPRFNVDRAVERMVSGRQGQGQENPRGDSTP